MREANDRGFECLLVTDATESYFPEFKAAMVEMVRPAAAAAARTFRAAAAATAAAAVAAGRRSRACWSKAAGAAAPPTGRTRCVGGMNCLRPAQTCSPTGLLDCAERRRVLLQVHAQGGIVGWTADSAAVVAALAAVAPASG
jgi:hypothetical protein